MEVPMAMGRPKAVLVLDAEQREQLENLATSRHTTPISCALHSDLFLSVKDLVQKIDHHIQNSNRLARPFTWIATADSILGKVERLCKGISGTSH
jgi:hypothetical protein